MLLIAIDTSGRHGSVALCHGGQHSFETLQLMPLEGGTYSARLMPAIAEMLDQHGISKGDLDGFVVVSGPGSFTGLRVGIATVKGLCEVLHKPLTAITMLEAVAIARGPEADEVTVALDAGRGEVYVGDFTVPNSHATCVREYITKLDAFASETAASHRRVLTPDIKVAEALNGIGAAAEHVTPVHADDVGRIGLSKLLAGETIDYAMLDANYIRRSDAEIFAPKR